MTTTSPSRKLQVRHRIVALLFVLVCVGLFSSLARAQEGQRLSVTPALFEMSAAPLQEWRSSIKVVNGNPYALTVYVAPMNFAPRGEGGDGSLIPILEGESDGATLAEWIEVSREAIEIPPEQTRDVPFVVRVPEGAAPGGHFAAFTVSTKPPAATAGASQIRTAQVVTALFFVRIAGDVIESGSIREFRAEKRFVSTPEITFGLRFENDGNVHLRPQGNIVITNMWGQERGVIPINRQSHFGNVLPNSIRKFTFTWEGDLSLSDIGRYEASVTLAYGQDSRQFVTSVTHFWVIPLMPLLLTLVTLVSILGLAIWLIRWYVRRMLKMSGYVPVPRQPVVRANTRADLDLAHPAADVSVTPRQSLSTYGRLLFRWLAVLQGAARLGSGRLFGLVQSRSERQRVLLGSATLLTLLILLGLFLRGAFVDQRSYQVRYDDLSANETVSSDQIEFESQRQETTLTPERIGAEEASKPLVDVVNVSGVAGAGATIALLVETKGYQVGEVTTELGMAQGRTVIVYDPIATDVALALSADLGNAPLSAFSEPASTTAPVVVYVGSDIVSPATP